MGQVVDFFNAEAKMKLDSLLQGDNQREGVIRITPSTFPRDEIDERGYRIVKIIGDRETLDIHYRKKSN